MMHAARLGTSPRLRAVRDALADGAERSTLDLVHETGVLAINSVVSELRANGFTIHCRQTKGPGGGRIWLYRLIPQEDAP